MLTVKEASLISTMVEGILYGFSSLMFVITLWSLICVRTGSSTNKLMLTATFLLFILSTLHITADILYLHRGFIKFDGDSGFFIIANEETFKNSVYELETLLADAILIYRCYIVWQSWWIIMVPCILWIAVAVSATATVWLISQPSADGTDIFLIQVGRWVVSFYSTAFVTNVVATGLLAYRIWQVNRNYRQTFGTNTNGSQRPYSNRGNLRPLLIFIIECGALYSCALLTMLSAYLTKSTGAYVIIDLIGQIIPITFYGIIIRASISRSHGTGRKFPMMSNNFSQSRNNHEDSTPTTLGIRIDTHQHDDNSTELSYITSTHSANKEKRNLSPTDELVV